MISVCSTDVLIQGVKIELWQTQNNRLTVSSWLWEPTWEKEREKSGDLGKFENPAMRTGTSEGETGPDILPILREVSNLRCLNVNPIVLLAT